MRAGGPSAPAPTAGVAPDLRPRPPAPGYPCPIFLDYPHAASQSKVWNSGATRPDVAGTTAPVAGCPSAPALDLRGGF